MDTSQVGVSMTDGRSKRRYRTILEKRQIVEEALSGQRSLAAVARQHGVNANLLFNWRKLYQQGLLDAGREPTGAALVPVQVVPEAPVAPVDFTGSDGHLEIDLPGGICIRVHGRIEVDSLAVVLKSLQI